MIGNRLFRLAGVVALGMTLVLSFGAVAAQDATPAAQTQQPYLGVSIAVAETGAMVTAVAPNSPAEQAGVQANDVITTFDGQKVTAEALADDVAQHSVGDSVKLTVLRGEQTVDLTVTLAARPATTAPANVPGNQGNAAQSATTPYIGLGLTEDNNAVTVAEVAAGSPAETAGFKVGDVVTKIGDTDVKTAQDVITVVRAAKPGDKLTLRVTRSGADVAIDVTVGQTTIQQLSRGSNRGNFQGMNGDAFSFNGTSWDIQSLDQNSALYKAGLRAGDQITAMNGSDKLDPQSLMQALMGQNDANATVSLTITRDGQSQTLDVPASALQEMMMGGFGSFPFGNDQGNGNGFPFGFGQMGQAAGGVHLGVEIINLDATTARQHNLTVTDGALVTAVEPNSPANKAGVKVNDVITAIDGDKVTQRRTLVDRMYGWKDGDEITVTVLRDGQSMDLKATLEAAQQQGGQSMNESPLQFFFGNGGQNGNGFQFPNLPAPQQTQPDQALPTT
jgi:S1-C subfamily serine protease